MSETKTCFRCGDPLTFCQCQAEYDEARQAFVETNGRAPSPDEMFQLQPQTALEAEHFARKAPSPPATEPAEGAPHRSPEKAALPELVCTRLLPFPRERAFAALSDLDQLVQWWGPDGFSSTSEAFDFRPGGSWTMVMHGPDGTDYPNLYRFLEIETPARVVLEHPDPAHWFELTLMYDEAPGGTLLTWRQRFDSEAHFAQIKDFVSAANRQILARLEAVLAR